MKDTEKDIDTDVSTEQAKPAEPPTNDAGEYICGRRTEDETTCYAVVSLPYVACHQHDGVPFATCEE